MRKINITPAFAYDRQKYKPDNIESNIIIHFRPAKEWLGKDYGFDWMREVDYDLVSPNNSKGDAKKYEETVSKHYREPFKPNPKPESEKTDEEKAYETAMKERDARNPYRTTIDGKPYLLEEYVNAYNGTFVTDPAKFRELERVYKYHHIILKNIVIRSWDDVGFTPYYCSWMSIYPDPDKEVKLSLVAEALDDKMPDSYELEYDDEYFDISLDKEAELKSLTKGQKKGVPDAITLTCKKEFDKDQVISIYTIREEKRRLAGRMYVWSNEEAKQKKANIVSVIVKTKAPIITPAGSSTNVASTTPSSTVSPIDKTKELNAEYLRQALIELKDEEVIILNLLSDKHFEPKDVDGSGGHYYHSNGIVGYYTSSAIWNAEKGRHIHDGEPEGYLRLGEYLYEKIKEQLKAKGLDENKYENYSRVYYLDQNVYNTNGKGYSSLGGYSEVGSKAIVLENGAAANTVAHEILHALNLMHSFNNREYQRANKFCFKFKTTDNLMDYSHLGFGKIPMNCLWKTQWEVANKSVMADGSIKSKEQLQDEHIIIPK